MEEHVNLLGFGGNVSPNVDKVELKYMSGDRWPPRGFTHKSPLFIYTGKPNPINASKSLEDLLERCSECRKRYNCSRIKHN
jgi:hypothetical protein